MLQKLNERVKGVFAWLIIVLVAFTFAMFGLDYYMQARQSSSSVASVNGQGISKNLFEQAYQRFKHENMGVLSASVEAVIKKQVLQELITKTVLLQSAAKRGFYVSPQQVFSTIARIPQFQENNRFSPSRYQQVLAASGYTPSTLQAEVQQSMLISQQRFMFVETEFVLPQALREYAKLLLETRRYQYALIPLKSFIDDTNVEAGAIKAYYDAHQKEFVKPMRVSLDYILLSLDQFNLVSQIKDEQVHQYYQDNLDSFKVSARWKLSHVFYAFPKQATLKQQEATKEKADQAYQVLSKNPTQFDEWVKKYSDDALSKPHDGVLPWMTLGETQFDQTLGHLTQIGKISSPVKTSTGYEIFKVIDYVPSSFKPFEQVKKSIRTQLANEQAHANYAKALETLGELSYQNPESLETVATALKRPVNQSEAITEQGVGSSDPITQHPEVLRQAFSPDVKDLGNNSEPIQINPTTVVVIRVKKQYPAEPESLQTVQAKITQILKKEAAKKAVEQLAKQVVSGEKSLPSQFKWQPATDESRLADTKHKIIKDLAFQLHTVPSMAGGYLENQNDYVLVKLLAIQPGSEKKLDPAQRSALIQQLQDAYGSIEYDLYVQSLLEKAKIKQTL